MKTKLIYKKGADQRTCEFEIRGTEFIWRIRGKKITPWTRWIPFKTVREAQAEFKRRMAEAKKNGYLPVGKP